MATDTSDAGALRSAGVQIPLVQQHLRVRMYPDHKYRGERLVLTIRTCHPERSEDLQSIFAGGDREELLLPRITSRDGNPAGVQKPGTGA
jgi:hypothetical protein